jgi:two-component system sensor histidine kinase MprB
LRARLTLVAAVSVVAAVLVSSFVVYFATRRELLDRVDDDLAERVAAVQLIPRTRDLPVLGRFPPRLVGTAGGFAQTIDAAGRARPSRGSIGRLPVSDRARRIASTGAPSGFETVSVDGVDVRVLTSPLSDGLAVQVGAPIEDLDATLSRLRRVLLLVTAAATVLAAVLGWFVARVVLRPVQQLTTVAEHVTETRDLSQRIPVDGDDELARLARSFNTMLEALDGSIRSQRALVADASHELRTPLTSIRTNIEVLTSADGLAADERARILQDVETQIVDLSAIVTDVIELARGDEPAALVGEVRLDELAERAVARAESHRPEVRFETALTPVVVHGAADRIARAVDNLVDNAGKWSPPAGTVRVSVRAGEVRVDDEGPGVSEVDAVHVFDRFWRSSEARRLPGSGLGLAIVKQVADQHHGTVGVEPSPMGGASFWMRFPDAAEPEA